MSKWLKFDEYKDINDKRKTKIWNIENTTSDVLGQIRWHNNWRKYCFFPQRFTIWDVNCLNDIIIFLNVQNSLHKEELKNVTSSEEKLAG